jgi:hypothetical protein
VLSGSLIFKEPLVLGISKDHNQIKNHSSWVLQKIKIKIRIKEPAGSGYVKRTSVKGQKLFLWCFRTSGQGYQLVLCC